MLLKRSFLVVKILFFFLQSLSIFLLTGTKKVYGCSLPGEDREGSSSLPKAAEGFLFAPSDITPWEAEGKDDMHGIGYQGIQDQLILGSRKATKSLYGMSGEVGGVLERLGMAWCWT